MTSTNEYSIHIYFIYKLIITRIAQLNDIESVIIYLRVLSGHRFDVDIERTIGNGFSRNRRLHSLSLSLSLLRLSMPISGFPSSYLEYISTYITIVRRDGSMERSAEQSVTRCRIDREEISPKTNISLPTTNRGESSRNRDDRISLPSEPGIVTISGLRGENDL